MTRSSMRAGIYAKMRAKFSNPKCANIVRTNAGHIRLTVRIVSVIAIVAALKLMTPNEIGDRLRAARRFLRLRQQTVADYLGMKRQTYIQIEHGKRKLMATEIPPLCNLLRITPNDLLGFSK